MADIDMLPPSYTNFIEGSYRKPDAKGILHKVEEDVPELSQSDSDNVWESKDDSWWTREDTWANGYVRPGITDVEQFLMKHLAFLEYLDETEPRQEPGATVKNLGRVGLSDLDQAA